MVKLSKISTKAPKNLNKEEIKREVEKLSKKIGDLQHIIYATKKQSVLVVLQGMDASGKDGVLKNVFNNCNPSGLDVTSYKKPSDEEFAHDFLWRCHKAAPAKGQLMVFVRSHYEDILIQKVHGWIDDKKAANRMTAINAFEKNLQQDNNTTVLKFYLHISPEVQLEKLQERIDLPEKNWKHNAGDWEERKFWSKYMQCYEYAINKSEIPWNIVPSDSRWYRNYFVAKAVLEALKKLNLSLPVISPDAIPAEAKKPSLDSKNTSQKSKEESKKKPQGGKIKKETKTKSVKTSGKVTPNKTGAKSSSKTTSGKRSK